MDEAVGTRITNVIITKHELTKEQKLEITEMLSEVAKGFADRVDKQNEEQLYYVKSPIAKNKILGYTSPSGYSFVLFELSHLSKTMFSRSELAQVQEENPGLNIEFLKVRVEDYDNGQDN